MCNRFEILVEGIDDASLVSAVELAIRDSFREMAVPGSWRVVVRPSHATGQWDFTIHGLDVRHALSIAVPPQLLPNLIPRRLRELLDRTVCRSVEGPGPATAQSYAGPLTTSSHDSPDLQAVRQPSRLKGTP